VKNVTNYTVLCIAFNFLYVYSSSLLPLAFHYFILLYTDEHVYLLDRVCVFYNFRRSKAFAIQISYMTVCELKEANDPDQYQK